MTQPANLHHKYYSTKIYTETKFTPDIPWSKNNHHLPSNFISSLPPSTNLFPFFLPLSVITTKKALNFLSFSVPLFFSVCVPLMERARRPANRAILKRLVNGSKQSHNQAINSSSLLNSSSSVSCTPSRYLSSLSSFGSTRPRSGLFPGNENSISHNVAAVSAGYYGVGSQIRSISVESLKPNDHFPRRHN